MHVEVHIEDGTVDHVLVEVDGDQDRVALARLVDAAAADSTIVRAVAQGAPVTVALR